ncbi:VIT1/CCC1 transporter family protein [Pseudoxanthomonas sp. NC8]|nr:VIT1/CCC1 transporter family protein [Pseudoxanthomonas sp. NC8]
MFRSVRDAPEPALARQAIAAALPPLAARLLREDELESLRQRLAAAPEPAGHDRLVREHWLGALGVCLLVVFTTFPLALPFLLLDRVGPAMRVSNAVALVMLFLAGVVYARGIGRPGLRVGVGMTLLGVVLAALTIALGG